MNKIFKKKYDFSCFSIFFIIFSFWGTVFGAKPLKYRTKIRGNPDFFEISPTLRCCNFFSTEVISKISDFFKGLCLFFQFPQCYGIRARWWHPPMRINIRNFAKIPFTALRHLSSGSSINRAVISERDLSSSSLQRMMGVEGDEQTPTGWSVRNSGRVYLAWD